MFCEIPSSPPPNVAAASQDVDKRIRKRLLQVRIRVLLSDIPFYFGCSCSRSGLFGLVWRSAINFLQRMLVKYRSESIPMSAIQHFTTAYVVRSYFCRLYAMCFKMVHGVTRWLSLAMTLGKSQALVCV